MRNKNKTRKGFRVETEDRRCFPDIETSRPEFALYPELSSSSSHTFMYMRNFDTRDYQIEISLSAVTQNTLIVIPTGLGKTFIAAMLIINFYRWFPTGKIIFMATSRPLVKQQMDSIKRLSVIPKKDIVEITGGVVQTVRTSHWQNSKVFFATPQTIQKDIERGVCPVSQIVLIVVDEAHHARGNHSYCQIIRKVAEVTKFFRIIALTATPGSTVYDIQQVIYNLMISKIEIRTDDDCAKYVHTRDVQSIIIQDAPGVAELSARLNSILQEYLEKLLKMSLVTSKDPTRTSKGKIAMLMKSSHSAEASIAIKQAIRLLNLREKLENYSIPFFTHDLEEFVNSKDRPIDKTNDDLKHLLIAAKNSPQDDPKMKKLCELVVNFLQNSSENSKIIVFCSYRNIVKEIARNLTEASPVVKCAEFVGQSSSAAGLRGLNQPKQLKVMDAFKRGIYNVLISTSIGEEGLDIGEVDLIICYDVQKSATRTIQRMGRTGRHQDGNVIFLLSEASKNLLHTAEKAPDTTSNLISRNMSEFEFYQNGPKMNDNKLQIIFKKFSVEEMENYEKQISKEKEVKRSVLVTSELDELHEHHGEKLAYHPFDLGSNLDYLAGSVLFSNITMSAESKLLSDAISSILQASVQCTPTDSLSLPSQTKSKTNYSIDTVDINFSEKSPFALDESSSQKVFNVDSPSSSQKKPAKISVRQLLNLDMSTDTSATDTDSDSDDIFSKNMKKTSNINNNTNFKQKEIDTLKKNAQKTLQNEVLNIAKEVVAENNNNNQNQPKSRIIPVEISDSSDSSDTSIGLTTSSNKSNEKQPEKNSSSIFSSNNNILNNDSNSNNNSFGITKKQTSNQVQSFRHLADISEITSSDSALNNDDALVPNNSSPLRRSNQSNKISNLSELNDLDNDDSGFIPPTTRSNSTSSSRYSASPKRELPINSNEKQSLHSKSGKLNAKKVISLISGSNSEYDEEEDYSTSLGGFIANSSQVTENSQQMLKRLSYSNSSSSSDSENQKKRTNRKSYQSNKHSVNYEELGNNQGEKEEEDDDVTQLNPEDVGDVNYSANNNIHNFEYRNDEYNNNDEHNNNFEHNNYGHSNYEDNNYNYNNDDDGYNINFNNNYEQNKNSKSNLKEKGTDDNLLRFFTNKDLEQIIHQEEEKTNNQMSLLNLMSDDSDDIICESSSFVSTSSEIIDSEINDYESDSGNEGNHAIFNNSPINVISSEDSDDNNNTSRKFFLDKVVEAEESDYNDSDFDRKASMNSKNYRNLLKYQPTTDDSENGSQKIDKNVSIDNISFIPLGKLIKDEKIVTNDKKINFLGNSSDSFDIENSSE